MAIDKNVGQGQTLSLQEWGNIKDQMQDGEHLRTENKDHGARRIWSRSDHGSTARPRWMTKRRAKFHNMKLELRKSVESYLQSQGMREGDAETAANQIMNRTLKGGKRLNCGRFAGFMMKMRGNQGLTKQDIAKVLDAARAKAVGFNSTQAIRNHVIDENQQEIRFDDPQHNIPEFDEKAQEAEKPVRVLGKHNPQVRADVQRKIDPLIDKFAVMVSNRQANPGDVGEFVLQQLVKDPETASLIYQVAKGQASAENIAFLLELNKLEELVEAAKSDHTMAAAAEQKADHIFQTYVTPGKQRTINFGDKQKKRDAVCQRLPRGQYARVQNNASDFLNALRSGDANKEVKRYRAQPFNTFIRQFCDSDVRRQLNGKLAEIEANSVALKPPANDAARPQPEMSLDQQLSNLVVDMNARVPVEYQPNMRLAIDTAAQALKDGDTRMAAQAISVGKELAAQAVKRAERVHDAFDNQEALLLESKDRSGGMVGNLIAMGRVLLDNGDVSGATRLLQNARLLLSGNVNRQTQLDKFERMLGGRIGNFNISDERQNELRQLLDKAKSAPLNQDIQPILADAFATATTAISEAIIAEDEESVRSMDDSAASMDIYNPAAQPTAGRDRNLSNVSDDFYDNPEENLGVQMRPTAGADD